MKKGILITVAIIFSVSTLMAQNRMVKNNPDGAWKFSAPDAPENYTSGTIVVGSVEKNHTATISFTGIEYKLPGERVTTLKDSLLFYVYLEGENIRVMLKMISDTDMSGKAIYSEGEVPLTLTKILSSDADVKK